MPPTQPEERACTPRVDKKGQPAGTAHALEPLFAGKGFKEKLVGHICDCGIYWTPRGLPSQDQKVYRGRVVTNKSHMVRVYG